jgi:hypothetical protein
VLADSAENFQHGRRRRRRALSDLQSPNYDRGDHATMRFLTMQRPLLAAAVSNCISIGRPTVAAVAPRSVQLANVLALGRRHASVKAQGAYRKKCKRGIPKKLGAKRTGGK